MALTYLSSFTLPNFLLGSLKEFPGLDWSGRLDLESSKLTSIVIKAWHYKCALIRIAQFAVVCSFIVYAPKQGCIGSNISRIASGTIATPTTDYIATSILHHIFIIILALY